MRPLRSHLILVEVMGFRSTFVTGDCFGEDIPEWFIEKYQGAVNINGCLSSTHEYKSYGFFNNLEEDIQKIIRPGQEVAMVWLHECGGITKVHISKNTIVYMEPETWKTTDDITHNYCYGCSDQDSGKGK